MTHEIEIESAQLVTADELHGALSESGLESEVVETWPRARLRFTMDGTAGEIATAVGHALDGWGGNRELQLVPQAVGESLVVLRPPTA